MLEKFKTSWNNGRWIALCGVILLVAITELRGHVADIHVESQEERDAHNRNEAQVKSERSGEREISIDEGIPPTGDRVHIYESGKEIHEA